MRKWVISGVVLASFCAIVVLALMNLNSLINRNKDYLIGQAEQALGRKVSVGEVAVTLWNGIGLRLDKFSLSDDSSFSKGDFVRARDLQVNVKLLPLLRKELRVKRLILHDPVIGIVRNKNGEYNFSSIGKRGKEREKAAAEESARSAKRTAPAPLLISLIDISGGEARYLDHKEGIDISVKRIDLRVKDLDFNEPVAVALEAALFSEKQNLQVKARLGPLRPEADFHEIPLEGEIDMDPVDFGKLTAAVPNIAAALPRGVELSGVFRIKRLQLKGTPNKLAFKGELEGTNGSISVAKTFQKAPGIPLVVAADAQYANNSVSLRQAKVKLHTLELAGKGEIGLGSVASLNLSIDSNRFSLDGWEKIAPPLANYQLAGNLEIDASLRGTVGKGAMPHIQGVLTLSGVSARPPGFSKAIKDLSGQVSFTGQRADLKETTLTLGNSRIRLAAEVERFSPLALSYKVSTPEIWPADFQSSAAGERKSDVMKNLSSAGRLSLKNGTLAFEGGLSSGQGSLHKIGYKDLQTSLVVENNAARVENLRVNALNGSLQAGAEYSWNSPVPRFSVAGKVQGLDLKELYGALDPKGPRDIQGRLNAELKVSARGKDWEQIKPELRGQGEAEVLQGALLNFNLAEGVLSGITGVPGLTSLINPQVRQKYPETFEAKDTEFKELKALFSLEDGRMNVKNLRITAADYTVQGNGRVDFNRRVDFRSVLVFSQRLSADLARSAREVSYMFNDQNQFEIPFALSGILPRVKPKPDSSHLAKTVQRGMVRKGTEELQRRFFGAREPKPGAESPPPEQKSRDQAPAEELLRKGLESLFGR